MHNLLALKIALRYLWSRKSHSAVTAIAIAGVCGVAVATMAIVCVLSVFNGFHEVIISRDNRITPDILVEPAKGALIANADSLAATIDSMPQVASVTPVVQDDAVAYFNSRQLPVRLLGVQPTPYRHISAIDSLIVIGKWNPQTQDTEQDTDTPDNTDEQSSNIEQLAAMDFDESALFSDEPLTSEPADIPPAITSTALASSGVAQNLNLPPTADAGVIVFIPRRTGNLNTANPAASFMADSLAVTGIYNSEQSEFDASTLIVDIDVARRLLEYDTQSNAIYLSLKQGINPATFKQQLSQRIGSDYKVSGRLEQQTLHFQMVSIEKWITFLLLGFILLIASFNIISTLSMLIVEKRHNLFTLTCIGASRPFIGRIFFWESIVVCMAGTCAGIILGVVLCALQAEFGLIGMQGDPSTLIIQSYPVSLRLTDLGAVLLLGATIAVVTALISATYASSTTNIRTAKGSV